MTLNVGCLLIQTLSSQIGVTTVQQLLTGNADISFSIDVQTATGGDYQSLVTQWLETFHSATPNNFALIIYDTMISSLTSSDVSYYFLTAINNNLSSTLVFDALNFNVFLDSCNQYTNLFSIGDGGLSINRTTGARGTGAILFAPSGVNKFLTVPKYPSLNETLYYSAYNGLISTYSYVPCIFNFNPRYTSTNSDYVRTAECSNVKNPNQNDGNITAFQFFLFIIIIVLILIVVMCLFLVTPKYVMGIPKNEVIVASR